jgi:mpaB/rubber oxygenase-like protein
MGRYAVRNRILDLDPAVDFREICRLMTTFEFPWDMNQALSFALFRTYAVPSIGGLLARTGELVGRVQKRYDDTVVLLDEILEHGPTEGDGRTALQRMNRMHGSYDISNDDLRYVLCTFVVMPIRWLDAYGWRAMTETERIASANYYRELGRHMNIKDRPGSYQEFAEQLDAYERRHFAYSPGGRAVSDATLKLLAGFYPAPVRPLLRRVTLALLDPPLREAFCYPEPDPVTRALTVAGLRARAAIERRMPARRNPRYVRQRREFAIYPEGYAVDELGTFPARTH